MPIIRSSRLYLCYCRIWCVMPWLLVVGCYGQSCRLCVRDEGDCASRTHNDKSENSCLFQDQLNRCSPSFRPTMVIVSFWNTTSVLDTRQIYHVACSVKCKIPLWKQLKTELLGLFHLNKHSIIIIVLRMILNHLIFTTWDTCINFTSYTTLRDEEGPVCMKIHRLCFAGHLPSSLRVIFLRTYTNLSKHNNIYYLLLGCNSVAVVILHVYKLWNWLLINLSREGYMRSM